MDWTLRKTINQLHFRRFFDIATPIISFRPLPALSILTFSQI